MNFGQATRGIADRARIDEYPERSLSYHAMAELAETSGAWVRGVLDTKEIGVLTKLLGKLAKAGDASTA